MDSDQLLPIKVVFKRDEDYEPPEAGGGAWEPFCDVTRELRESFAEQVMEVKRYFDSSFRRWHEVPAVAKVRLKPKAVAKTYRPTELFAPGNCPLIGTNRLGELYVSVRPLELDRLAQKIKHGDTEKIRAHISTLELIQPFTDTDALGVDDLTRLQGWLADGEVPRLRFRLFRHLSPAVNDAIDAAFDELARESGIREKELMNYAEGLRVYRLSHVPADKLIPLARFVGTQSLGPFPSYKTVRTTSRVLGRATGTHFPPPDPGRDYPLVGVIDSGTDPDNPHLQAWVTGRYDFVPRSQQDNDHGSFVAGLLVHGRALNNGHRNFPSVSSQIVDVVVMDRSAETTEDVLLTALDEALQRFPDVKVWNLSLGVADAPCPDEEFSLLGAALDQRAKDHGVLFVIAAGNYLVTPCRSWPPQPGIEDGDRICPPADSLRGLTVGSLAHLDTMTTCVRRDEPSPFSRRGPGPAYTIKPELAHYGGNCTPDGRYVQTGIISLDGSGNIAENIGTSFATPLVSTVAAGVYRELDVGPGAVTPSLVKALLVHGAFVRNGASEPQLLHYRGAGVPPEVGEILNCRQSSATIILQVPVQRNPEYFKDPFPMPACLSREGVFRGEIFMTLLYEPPLDRAHGIEYCRCNVNASLGTVVTDPSTGEPQYTRRVHPYPKELGEGYEKNLIKNGYKWSPLKFFYRKFSKAKIAGQRWRLKLETLDRSQTARGVKHDVILVITIRSQAEGAQVYDELVREMEQLGWGAQDLQIRSRPRLRP